MILAHYHLDASKVDKILQRFHEKFKRRLTFKANPNPYPKNIDMDTIKIIDIYKRTCKYANETENETKTNLVIKMQYTSRPRAGLYSLNVLYEDYKDLL